jgi:hypothetical protein
MDRRAAGTSHLGAGGAGLFGPTSGGWAGFLDTDDFGAHIAKNHGTERPRRKPSKIENGDSCKRSWHVVLLFRFVLSQR